MSLPRFPINRRRFCAESAREAVKDALEWERIARGMSEAEVGEIVHKSRDRVQDWRSGSSDMPLMAFFRLIREWGPGFANRFMPALLGCWLVPVSQSGASGSKASLLRLLARLEEIEDRDLPTLSSEIAEAAAYLETLRMRAAMQKAG